MGVRGGILLASITLASLLLFNSAGASGPKDLPATKPSIVMNDYSNSPTGDSSLMIVNGTTLIYLNNTLSQSVCTGINFTLGRIAWRPDGSYALIVSDGGTLLKFSKIMVNVVPIDSGTVADLTSVSWKPDGTFALITGTSGVMLRFDHQTQRCLCVPTNTNFKLFDVEWDTDGQHAEITGDNGTSIIYPPIQDFHPEVGITEPGYGSFQSGIFTIQGFARVENGSITQVQASIDSGGWLIATGKESWVVTFDSTPFVDGPHTLQVRAMSSGGEVATDSVVVQFINVPLPPLVDILSPVDDGRVYGTITIDGSASAWSGTVERVDVRVDDFRWGPALGTGFWRLSFDTTTLPNGVHRIQVRVWDGQQFSVASRLFIIENAPPSEPAPAPASRPSPTPVVVIAPSQQGGKDTDTSHDADLPAPAPPPATPSPAVREPASDGGTIVVPAFSWGLLLVTALALGTEHGKFAIYQMLFVPLYSRIKKDAVLDNFTRGMIYGFIMSNPGVHYNFIKQKLGLNNGSIVYHLTVLERQELIKSEKVGLYKRFYPVGQTLSETGIMELNDTQETLLGIVRKNPGMTQRELAERMDLSTRVINYHVGLLQRARLVTLEKVGKVTKCYATERMPVC